MRPFFKAIGKTAIIGAVTLLFFYAYIFIHEAGHALGCRAAGLDPELVQTAGFIGTACEGMLTASHPQVFLIHAAPYAVSLILMAGFVFFGIKKWWLFSLPFTIFMADIGNLVGFIYILLGQAQNASNDFILVLAKLGLGWTSMSLLMVSVTLGLFIWLLKDFMERVVKGQL